MCNNDSNCKPKTERFTLQQFYGTPMPRWAKENVIFRFCPLLPPANEVLGKVMFSQVCVIPSVHWGGGELAFQHTSQFTWSGGVCIQGVAWGGLLPWGICIQAGGLPPGGLGRPPFPRDTWDTMGYGQQVCSMHPTGMHSCLQGKCGEIWLGTTLHIICTTFSHAFICSQAAGNTSEKSTPEIWHDNQIQAWEKNVVSWHPE